MSTTNGDRNLLFGILALQMDFIPRDALIKAMNAWALDKAMPLGQILVEQGALRADAFTLLDALVQKHLEIHGGDPEKSLAAISSIRSVREELQGIADSEVQATLAHLPPAHAAVADPDATESPTVGAPSAEGGRFRILRPYAEGGLGKVSVAHDEELHREVALKEIQERYADHPESRARFLVEAEITGGLEHPGIVPVYGLGQYADGRPFYAMRFIRGDSLKEAIERYHKADGKRRAAGERSLELRKLLGRFVDVCEAIAYAHSRGVLHRDLKPGNIMLGKYGETLVVDWGLAKPVDGPASKEGDAEEPLRPSSDDGSTPTRMGSAVGTPSFMPPEQAAGRLDQLAPASDVYSLGATLYCLLTGKAPFEGGDVGAVLQRVQRGDFPRPRQVQRDVHPALEAVCLKAMALRPADRYLTPRALASDIEKWLADEPTTAYRESWRVRVGRWTRRHQTLVAATAAGVLVAILAGGAGAWWLEQQRLETRQAVEAALGEAGRLQGQAHWGEAQAVLDQAKHRLGAGGPGDLKARLDRTQVELDLVERLDAARLKRAAMVEEHFDFAGADRDYEEAFHAAGMAEVGGDAASASAWVRGSGVREAVVAALDDWAFCVQQRERRSWVLEVARQADPDPWRDRARDPAVWDDAAALARLAEEEAAAKQSPQLLAVLGRRLFDLGGDAEQLLRAAQQQYPGDYWINHNLGYILMQRKKFDEAVSYCRAALAVRPGISVEHDNLGSMLWRQGKLEEAAAEHRKAIDLDPNYAYAHNNLGNVLCGQVQWEEAAAEYRRAIELNSKYATPHNQLGNVLRDQGKREEAAAEYRKAIELDPKVAVTHNNLGNVLYGLGKLEEAAAEYRRASELDPKYAWPHNNLGDILRAQGQREEAAAEYRKAIELDPKFAHPHNGLGNMLYGQGQREEAAAEYRKAIELDPKFAWPHNNLGDVLRDQGKWEEAAAEYRKAIELDPKNAAAHYELGVDLRRQGKFDEATAEYHKVMELDPKNAKAHYGLGVVLYDQDKREEAVAEYRKAMELDPKFAWPHNQLGNALRDEGKQEEATAEYRKAIELGPKYAMPHNGLGIILQGQGKLDEAGAEYRKAIELNPNLTYAHSSLGNVLRDMNKLEEAAVEYRRARDLVDTLPVADPLRESIPRLLRQCEDMLALDKKLPAILKGEVQPADAAEQASLGHLCYLKKRYADSARFYADAFAAQPALADDLPSAHRYYAARAAVLASAGQGESADKMDDKERARLRQQALDLLRANLAEWGKLTENGTPQMRATLPKKLRHWQENPDLAGVRDADALDKLPEAERADWKKLWADVDALLKKSSDAGRK